MDVLLSIFAILLGIIGCIGCIVPVLPGPILAYGGYLCLYFCSYSDISTSWLIVFGVVTLAITILDYILPAYMTKRFGGTKAGERGAMAGVIVGMFLGPLGVILGPFFGAVIAELIYDKENKERAFKSGLGSFASFFVGTGIKILLASWLTIQIFIDVFKAIF